jgi:predicted histidine transporter YuiF (NhaC family)
MKKTNKIRRSKKSVIAFMGILVAILLFFQQPYSYHFNSEQDDSAPKAEQKDSSENAEFHVLSYEVLIPALQINLLHSFYLLDEIEENEIVKFVEVALTEKVFHNFFNTLYRQFISPNAP